jgi:hypothetical protein
VKELYEKRGGKVAAPGRFRDRTNGAYSANGTSQQAATERRTKVL